MQTQTTDQPNRQRCRHIFVDGRRCGSTSLRHEEFCYYHHTTRTPATTPRTRKARRSTVQLPLPEDRAAIQLSIGLILQRIATNELDPRRAGLLLYALQIASTNLPPHQKLPSHAQPLPEQPLEEVVAHPELGLLAPPADALKTYKEQWQDIRRKEDHLFEWERKLRDREQGLDQRQAGSTPQPASQTPRPPVYRGGVLIPPSCFAPDPYLPVSRPANTPAPAVLSDIKAEAAYDVSPSLHYGLTTRRGHGRIQPFHSPLTHDRPLQTPHRKDRLPRRRRRVRRVPGLRRDL
jgi:hypothetical protein